MCFMSQKLVAAVSKHKSGEVRRTGQSNKKKINARRTFALADTTDKNICFFDHFGKYLWMFHRRNLNNNKINRIHERVLRLV